MANQANGLAGMPGPHSVDAPSFSEDSSASFTDFLHEYEALAMANALTDAQKVETILRYVSSGIRKFWKSVDGFNPPNWRDFRTALVEMYPDTSAATRFTKRAL
jgi:hypothetical protein